MSKELVKTKKNEVAQFSNEDLAAWGESEANQNDVVIPKLIVMQANSSLVGEDKADAGDIIESLGKEVLAGYKKSVEIVPFYMKKTWIVKKLNTQSNEYEFERYEDVDSSNENADKDFSVNGEKYQRQFCRNFYCLIGDNPIPYIVPMKGMSARTGKILATSMYVQNKVKKLPPPGVTFKLQSTKESYEGRVTAAFKIEEAGITPKEKVLECLSWLKMIQEGSVRESQDEDLEKESKVKNDNSNPMF